MADASFASLSPTLLARKGGAKPAMRPQHAALAAMPTVEPEPDPEKLEDLGWNDMGEHPETQPAARIVALSLASDSGTALAPEPEVLRQREAFARKIAPTKTAARGHRERTAFTLRLDPVRHVKLRLACTMRDVSAQALVTEALDALLGTMPELDSLAAQVKRR
jgi:hypothetical protein